MSGSSSSQQSAPTVPGFLQALIGQETGSFLGAMQGLPNLISQYSNMPGLNVPGLDQGQTKAVQGLNAMGQNPSALTPGEAKGSAGYASMLAGRDPASRDFASMAAGTDPASQGYEQFMGTAGQPSSATNAALKEYQDLTAPAIQQQAELMGQGNSGAALAANAQGQEQALVPFMQQDLQNQLTATQGLAGQQATGAAGLAGQEGAGAAGVTGIGGQQYSQEQQSLMNSLQAAGVPYDIALQQAQAQFQQKQSQQQLAQGVQTQPFSLLGQTIGGGTSINTPAKF